jgi:hypothetical protein
VIRRSSDHGCAEESVRSQKASGAIIHVPAFAVFLDGGCLTMPPPPAYNAGVIPTASARIAFVNLVYQ